MAEPLLDRQQPVDRVPVRRRSGRSVVSIYLVRRRPRARRARRRIRLRQVDDRRAIMGLLPRRRPMVAAEPHDASTARICRRSTQPAGAVLRGERNWPDPARPEILAQPGASCRPSGRGSAAPALRACRRRAARAGARHAGQGRARPIRARLRRAIPAALSGGMGQRVMIAAMLIDRPKLLIADEPTSALDQRCCRTRSWTLLRSLTEEFGMGLLLISHDLQQVVALCRSRPGHASRRDRRQSAGVQLADATHRLYPRPLGGRPSAATYGTRLLTLGDRRRGARDMSAVSVSDLAVTLQGAGAVLRRVRDVTFSMSPPARPSACRPVRLRQDDGPARPSPA